MPNTLFPSISSTYADFITYGDLERAIQSTLALPPVPPVVATDTPVPPIEPSRIVFEVRHGEQETDRDTWETVETFSTGKEAASWVNWAKEHRDYLADSGRYTPVPMHHSLVIVRCDPSVKRGVDDWRDREALRFLDGTYKKLPWHDEPAMRIVSTVDHYAHVAQSDCRKVAFTLNDTKGRLDKQTVWTADKYLNEYGYRLSPEKLEAYVAEMMGTSIEVLFAHTSDEIVDVYNDISEGNHIECNSCMTHAVSDYATGGIHPCTVYGAGDLALAYIRDDDDQITARGLVWPAKGLGGRLYGNNTLALRAGLRALGYTNFDNSSLEGARLLKIATEYGNGSTWVMPYIDGLFTFGEHETDSSYWQIGGRYNGDRTDGIGLTRRRYDCDHCGEECYHDETERLSDGDRVCPDCYSEARTCECCGNTLIGDNMESVITSDNRWGVNEESWCSDCISSDATYLDHSGVTEGYYADIILDTCNECNEVFPEWSLHHHEVTSDNVCQCCDEAITDRLDEEALEAEEEEAKEEETADA